MEGRFEDTAGLFGVGRGMGTSADITCEWCGHHYTNREQTGGEPLPGSETIAFVQFGGVQVCDCCFGDVEAAVIRAMPDILPWFIRILQSRRLALKEQKQLVADLVAAIKEIEASADSPVAPVRPSSS